jgi:hypothetical protein
VTRAQAFNEWLRLYTEEPDTFDTLDAAVRRALTERGAGVVPTYGEACDEFLRRLEQQS